MVIKIIIILYLNQYSYMNIFNCFFMDDNLIISFDSLLPINCYMNLDHIFILDNKYKSSLICDISNKIYDKQYLGNYHMYCAGPQYIKRYKFDPLPEYINDICKSNYLPSCTLNFINMFWNSYLYTVIIELANIVKLMNEKEASETVMLVIRKFVRYLNKKINKEYYHFKDIKTFKKRYITSTKFFIIGYAKRFGLYSKYNEKSILSYLKYNTRYLSIEQENIRKIIDMICEALDKCNFELLFEAIFELNNI